MTAFCGREVTKPVLKSALPQLLKECAECITWGYDYKVPWRAVRPMRTERGRIAHYTA